MNLFCPFKISLKCDHTSRNPNSQWTENTPWTVKMRDYLFLAIIFCVYDLKHLLCQLLQAPVHIIFIQRCVLWWKGPGERERERRDEKESISHRTQRRKEYSTIDCYNIHNSTGGFIHEPSTSSVIDVCNNMTDVSKAFIWFLTEYSWHSEKAVAGLNDIGYCSLTETPKRKHFSPFLNNCRSDSRLLREPTHWGFKSRPHEHSPAN